MESRPRSPWRIAGWAAGAALLLVPLLAMQFTDEVNWDLADFIFAGALVAGVGVAYELAVRRTGNRAYRAAVAVALATAFVLVWANAAVGIIGSEDNPANAMFTGVLAVGLVGALIARFRAAGMAWALVATAVAQVGACVIASLADMGSAGPITWFFSALWLASAWLFRKSAGESPMS